MRNFVLISLICFALLLPLHGVLGRNRDGPKERGTYSRKYIAPDKSKNLLSWVRHRMNYISKLKRLRNVWEGWRFIHRPISRPWWKGPNVSENIVKESAIIQRKPHSRRRNRQCKDLNDAYRCLTRKRTENGTELVINVKECCKGYMRSANDYGCPKEIILKNMTAILNEHGLTNLIRAFESVGILSQLQLENITLFAPTNTAFQNPSHLDWMKDVNGQKNFTSMVAVNKTLTHRLVYHFQNILLNHVINTEITSHRMFNEQLIVANNSLQSTLRINTDESNMIMTVSCQNITTRNIMASNGIIHVVDGLLKPVTQSLDEVIATHPKLSNFRNIYTGSETNTTFPRDGHYTVFAPTNDAFNNTKHLDIDNLVNNTTNMKDLLRYHTIPYVICPIAIKRRKLILNMSGKNLTLERDMNGSLNVNGVRMSDSHIMARNGILYLVDEVILPEQEFDVLSVAERENATTFLELVNASQLEIDLQKAENIQVFIPSNEAFKELENLDSSLLQENDTLENVLRYHVSPSWNEKWYNNYEMDTWISDRRIRVNNYVVRKPSLGFTNHWTAQCATVTKSNLKADNGMVHIVDKVLVPPKGTIIDILKADGRFTDFVRYIELGGVSDMLEKEGPFTVFAPKGNLTFELNKLQLDYIEVHYVSAMSNMVTDHIVNDVLCCASISDDLNDDKKIQSYQRFQDLNIYKNSSVITVKGKELEECDIMATNGVIHVMKDAISDF